MSGIPSEFEEKEFEAPLYNQLEVGTRLVWSPGQVFEEYVGIDRALFLEDLTFWKWFGRATPLRGALLHRFDWDFIWRHRRRRPLPSFKLNLFIQAKRSFFHKKVPKLIKPHFSDKTCWHFDIDPDQQLAIGKVAAKLGERALVCYAAPAFHRFSQLTAHTVRGTIMYSTTFPLATQLNGHKAFYYCGPGGSGVANPTPELVAGEGLVEFLRRVQATAGTAGSDESPTRQLQGLAESIEASVRELPDSNARKGSFFQARSAILSEMEGPPTDRNSEIAFMTVQAFASVFNMDWFVVTTER